MTKKQREFVTRLTDYGVYYDPRRHEWRLPRKLKKEIKKIHLKSLQEQYKSNKDYPDIGFKLWFSKKGGGWIVYVYTDKLHKKFWRILK